MLDQIFVARAFRQHGFAQATGRVELVIARENQLLDLPLLVPLRDDVATEDFEPAVAPPDLLPEIAGRVAARVRRIARAAFIALVERQEASGRAVNSRRHHDFAVADREMDHCTAWERQQGLSVLPLWVGRPIEPILVHGVLNALGEVGLELDGRDWQAVEE